MLPAWPPPSAAAAAADDAFPHPPPTPGPIPTQEESFWTGRLAKLQQNQQPGVGPASPTSPTARIPAIHSASAAGPLAVIPAPQQHSAPLSCEPATALAAQVEALKLQVATLRRANAQLSRELAAVGAERARAARAAALDRLTQLQLEGSSAAAGTAAAAASQPTEASQAAAAALQAELGVALPPGSESVPLQHLERLHASYQARVRELESAHVAALERQRQEHEAVLRRQVGSRWFQVRHKACQQGCCSSCAPALIVAAFLLPIVSHCPVSSPPTAAAVSG